MHVKGSPHLRLPTDGPLETQTPLKTQVDAARGAVLAVPNLDRTALIVTGRDRVSWLNGLLTADLAKKSVGEVTYGLVVGRNGRILADLFVAIDEERVLVAAPAAAVDGLRQHLEHYLVMEDAEIVVAGAGSETWALHGPGWQTALAAARGAGGVGGMLDRTGLGGAFVFALSENAGSVRAAIEHQIAEQRGVLGDDDGWNTLRIERAVARFGVDFDERTYPQEAALEKVAVSFDKGCYLGQEVVCMMEMRGHVKRKLVPLLVETTDPVPWGAPVVDEAGAVVGEVTSAAFSPTLGKVVALAMLKRANAEPGSHVTTAGARAQVVAQPA